MDYKNIYTSTYRLILHVYKLTKNHLYGLIKTRIPVFSHQTTRVKTYHLSTKHEGDEFFNEGGLMTENSNEGGFLFIMHLKI